MGCASEIIKDYAIPNATTFDYLSSINFRLLCDSTYKLTISIRLHSSWLTIMGMAILIEFWKLWSDLVLLLGVTLVATLGSLCGCHFGVGGVGG